MKSLKLSPQRAEEANRPQATLDTLEAATSAKCRAVRNGTTTGSNDIAAKTCDTECDRAEQSKLDPSETASRNAHELRPPRVSLCPSKLRLKIVDLGNACWRNKHFTSDIQTRQYRCPEVILGAGYDISADIWSLACVLFEAATGDVLFNPRAGKNWARDEDHLALCIELLGKMPKKIAFSGKYSKDFFNRHGELRSIHNLKFWDLESVLINKYSFSESDAKAFSGFLTPMLNFNPLRRATASELLQHSWLHEQAATTSAAP